VKLIPKKSLFSVFLVLLVILYSMGLFPLSTWAEESSPSVFLRTSISPKNPVVGQQLEFRVDVFVDTWFAQAPQFPDLQVEDAIALLPASSSINLNQRIDGKSYVGQRRTYFVFPQLPGRYELPPISVQVTPAQPGMANPEPVSLSTEPISFLALLPPELATQSENPILATPELEINTQLATPNGSNSAHLIKLHRGETLERTITLTATDTLASILPAIAIKEIDGLSAYPDPPKLINRFERGEFTASRTEHIFYIAEQPGNYSLPAQSIVWWNTRTQSLQTEVIPAVEIRVIPTFQERLISLGGSG
jgi:hypothetical protein